MNAELIVLRLIHILGGILWVGTGLFTTAFLMPALNRLGPATAGPLMGALQQRHMFTVFPVVAVLTILTGIRLLHIVSGGFARSYFDSPTGQTFLWSGIAAIVAFILGIFVGRPIGLRIGALSASIATLPEEQRAARVAEVERLKRRGAVVSTTAMVLLIGAAAGMAIARYLG